MQELEQLDQATAARSIAELRIEIGTLKTLEGQGRRYRQWRREQATCSTREKA